MTKESPSLRHDFSTPVDLLSTLERLDIEALTVDETKAVVIYWRSVLRLTVIKGELTDAVIIAIEVWNEGDLPPDINADDLPIKFVNEIENTIS